MNAPAAAARTIRRADKAARDAGFERLLNEGLERLRRYSGERWTDHNLHDPGITMLEQLCFALSELAYRADFDVADHLARPDGSLNFEGLALHPPREALACRPTTAEDYRRWLLDEVPGADDALLRPHPAAGAVGGVLQLLLKPASRSAPPASSAAAPQRPAAAAAAAQAARRAAAHAQLAQQALAAYRRQRNLCEDVDPRVVPVRERLCELQGDIEISGPRDAAEVLAEVYHRAARWIDRAPRRLARRDMFERGLAVDEVYDGPALNHGFFDRDGEPGAAPLPGRGAAAPLLLYLSDLARELEAITGVHRARALALEVEGTHAAQSGAVIWRQDNWALRLHVPGEPGDKRAVRVELKRRQHVARVAADELWRRVLTLQVAERAQRRRLQRNVDDEERAELPRGRWREPTPYHSVQHHFPALYGLARHASDAAPSVSWAEHGHGQGRARADASTRQLSAGAGPGRAGAGARSRQLRARTRQLRAYLLLFEQVLANGEAQVQHLRELFSVAAAGQQSYWWQPLGPHQVPGLDGLQHEPPEELERRLRAEFDRSHLRKSRLLDHLLALHGETLTQNALRQVSSHLRADELDARLLDNKARYLNGIVTLGRDRAGAFDYSQPLWGDADNPNVCGLARRMSLLLGFRHDHARSLTAPLVAARIPYVEVADDATAPVKPEQADDAEALNVVDADEQTMGRLPEPRAMLARGRPQLLGPLLRAGAAHDGYRVLPLPTLAAGSLTPAATGALVIVGPDDRGRFWPLGPVAHARAAQAAAAKFRRTFVELNDECEGLHVVEHVLLRPVNADSPGHRQLEPHTRGFFGLSLTVVMPGWTVRTHQPAFRRLAEETLGLNVPSHIDARPIVWLGFDEMEGFEKDFERWLTLRRDWCREPTGPKAQALDAAACRLIATLLRRPGRPAAPGAPSP